MARIETYKAKVLARNKALLEQIQDRQRTTALPMSNTLVRSKLDLEEAKEQFLKELNRRDPTWADKVRQHKAKHIE